MVSSLADSEAALVGVGMAQALARVARAPWRAVIFDRMECIDVDHLGQVLQGLQELVVAGVLDNVIGAFHACEPVGELEGVTFHWLGGESAEGGEE